MNEIGKLLSDTRTEHGLDIEQVARETNIARRYLEALETDDYSVFPAEPYVVGFLRNYCEYLGLNPEEVIKLYKQVKIQETNPPTDELLPKKGFEINRSVLFAFVGIASLIIIVFASYFLFTQLLPKFHNESKPKANNEQVIEKRQPENYVINSTHFEKRLFVGDSVNLQLNGKNYILKVIKVSPSLELESESGKQVINLAENLLIDLNGDAITDVEILVEDIDKNNPELGALTLIKTGEELSKTKKEVIDVVVSGTSMNSSESKEFKVLFEGGSAYPVTMNATFRGYCLFRHESDRANREERYYQKAEQLTVQANNGFRIWASNGNAVKLQLVAGGKTVDLDISRPGEVIVKDLKWIRDDASKRYKFIITNVD